MGIFSEVLAGNRLVLPGLLAEINNADHISKIARQKQQLGIVDSTW
jgi:hypothetical protein